MNERLEKFFESPHNNDLANVHAYSSYIKNPKKIKTRLEVEEYDKKAVAEIEYLKSKIELMKIYRAELYNRFQEINAANYHTRITIERNRRYYENKVYYYVTVENVPDREDVASIRLRSDTFEGKKRHEALKLFETLRKVYPRAELVKKIEKSQWEK